MTQTNSQLPTIELDRMVVERPFKGSDKFGNLRVTTVAPVIRERGDGAEPVTSQPRYDITVSADRHPEAFSVLKNAPLGVHLRISAEVFGRGARVRSGANEYTNYLGQFEAVDAENLGFPAQTDATLAENPA